MLISRFVHIKWCIAMASAWRFTGVGCLYSCTADNRKRMRHQIHQQKQQTIRTACIAHFGSTVSLRTQSITTSIHHEHLTQKQITPYIVLTSLAHSSHSFSSSPAISYVPRHHHRHSAPYSLPHHHHHPAAAYPPRNQSVAWPRNRVVSSHGTDCTANRPCVPYSGILSTCTYRNASSMTGAISS